MLHKRVILLLLLIFTFGWAQSQEFDQPSILTTRYNDTIITPPKRPWKAALETFGVNVGIWAFDRYVLQGDYAHISVSTIKKNFQTGFVWDNDQFATNLFAHPYSGGLYFNTARANGMNFYESMPYAVGGSLMWEFFMENEPPAINDLIATSVGGFSLGEVTYRLSDLVIDSRSRGWERFGREFLATAISPMTGLNRVINGDAWKKSKYKGRSFGSVPAVFQANAMYRTLTENTDFTDNYSHSLYVNVGLIYGDPFDTENQKPYNYFTMKAGFNLISDVQPPLSNINAIGLIWGKELELKNNKKQQLLFGIFQHFDYYDSFAGIDDTTYHSYKISEAAAFGAGLIYKLNFRNKNSLILSAHLNGILLGGSLTDYYHAVDRDYNLGSGYSNKLKIALLFGSKIELGLSGENYHIFTWKGYDPNEDLSQLTHEEQIYLNAQGDKGNARLSILDFNFNYHITKHLNLSTHLAYYNRKSHYAYFDDVEYTVSEAKVGVGYSF